MSCSLVCKSWVPPSRYHIFSDPRVCTLKLNHVIALEKLLSQQSTFPPYFQTLRLADSDWISDSGSDTRWTTGTNKMLKWLGETLDIRSLAVFTPTLQLWDVATCLPKVTDLTIKLFASRQDVFSPDGIFGLVKVFNNLQALTLYGSCPKPPSKWEPSSFPLPLHTLRLHITAGMEHVLLALNYATLKKIQVFNVAANDSCMFQAYLQRNEQSLSYLKYEFGGVEHRMFSIHEEGPYSDRYQQLY
jgi:hypothetical protein